MKCTLISMLSKGYFVVYKLNHIMIPITVMVSYYAAVLGKVSLTGRNVRRHLRVANQPEGGRYRSPRWETRGPVGKSR